MPRGLSPAARRIWRELAPALQDAGLLSAVDAGPFALYCQSLAFGLDAASQLSRDGLTVADRAHGGELRKHAAWQIFMQASAAVARWTAHFGTTARARQSLPVDESPAAELVRHMTAGSGGEIVAEEW